jgi:prepilin-type N-terminal cleavage/methylation domain-containing protein
MSLRTPPISAIKGFTLVELLIAVAVMAVLVTLAAPSFRDLILMQRMKGIHAQLVTDLQYARSEAVSSGAVVNLRVQRATSGVPNGCYIIFQDFNRNYLLNGPSTACNCRLAAGSRCPTTNEFRELRTVEVPVTSGVALTFPALQTREEVAFDPKTGGMMLMANELGLGTGRAFMTTVQIDEARSLSAVVGVSGRPRICRPLGSTLPDPDC